MNTSGTSNQVERKPVLETIAHRKGRPGMRKALLFCGILASLLYTAMNIFIPLLYPGYHMVSKTVSELSAVGSPTKAIWLVPALIYTLLVAAFGLGIKKSAGDNASLRILGTLMIISGIVGLAWSPMHQREVIAAGGGTFTDTWHIVMSIVTVFLMMLMIGFGAAGLGKSFRIYSIASMVIFIVFGVLTSLEAPGINRNAATPMIGVWERINIGTYMLWMIVLALILSKKERSGSSAASKTIKNSKKSLWQQY